LYEAITQHIRNPRKIERRDRDRKREKQHNDIILTLNQAFKCQTNKDKTQLKKKEAREKINIFHGSGSKMSMV
jgi:hypothetical protein